MTLTYDFSGQVAVETGASTGMGAASARAFAEAGASVGLVDHRRRRPAEDSDGTL